MTLFSQLSFFTLRMLHDISSDITTLSINVIDSSRRVVQVDTSTFDELKKYCRIWAVKVTKCENIINAIVQMWKDPVEIVFEALQNQNIHDINSSVSSYVSFSTLKIYNNDFFQLI